MALAREKKGRYTGHHTPGDGTGLDHVPTHEWHEALDDEKADTGANVGPIHYPARSALPEHGQKKSRYEGTWPTGYGRMTK